jgi:hypothetical protein
MFAVQPPKKVLVIGGMIVFILVTVALIILDCGPDNFQGTAMMSLLPGVLLDSIISGNIHSGFGNSFLDDSSFSSRKILAEKQRFKPTLTPCSPEAEQK